MTNLPAIILAGGRATRMGGGDKALLDLGGRSLVGHVISRVQAQCGPLAISANGDAARFARFGLPVLADSIAERPGPLAGILAGLDWAAGQGAGAVISLPVDTPFLPLDLASRLAGDAGPTGCALAAGRDATGAIHDHPVIALWPVGLRGDLRAALLAGERRVGRYLARQSPGRAIWLAAPLDPFFNINRPEDLARAIQIAASG